jgi:hypothetical protein
MTEQVPAFRLDPETDLTSPGPYQLRSSSWSFNLAGMTYQVPASHLDPEADLTSPRRDQLHGRLDGISIWPA